MIQLVLVSYFSYPKIGLKNVQNVGIECIFIINIFLNINISEIKQNVYWVNGRCLFYLEVNKHADISSSGH